MYFTVRVRMRLDAEDRHVLLAYEKEYHMGLRNLIDAMEKSTQRKSFSYYKFPSIIHKASQWAFYQIGLKLIRTTKGKHKGVYQRSSTWAKPSFEVKGNKLTLLFGETFITKKGVYLLAIDEKQEHQLRQGKQVRLDLVHDEYEWYCNILIQLNDS